MKEKTLVVIAGPTASGKTALAIELAQKYNSAVISADSRQCFKELNIGVAKPSAKELATVPHYFINTHSITENVTAQDFADYAGQAIQTIFKSSDVAVMAGGTGLYIQAFCNGLDAMPEIPAALRLQISGEYNEKGLEWLQQQVQEKDPGFWHGAEQQNPRRLMRALEIVLATGKSINDFRLQKKTGHGFRILKFCIDVERNILYERINKRVLHMMEAGLLDEVGALEGFRGLNALQTVGYKELFEYIDGGTDLKTAIANIQQNTRNYAKRQLTWFKKDPEMRWGTNAEIVALLHTFLS